MCFSDGNAVSVLIELFHISPKRLLLLDLNPMCALRCFVILIRLGVSGQESVCVWGGGGGGRIKRFFNQFGYMCQFKGAVNVSLA